MRLPELPLLTRAVNRVRKLTLLAQFSMVALVLMAGIAYLLASGIQGALEQNALHQEAENAAEQVATILDPYLTASDMTGQLNPARYAASWASSPPLGWLRSRAVQPSTGTG